MSPMPSAGSAHGRSAITAIACRVVRTRSAAAGPGRSLAAVASTTRSPSVAPVNDAATAWIRPRSSASVARS